MRLKKNIYEKCESVVDVKVVGMDVVDVRVFDVRVVGVRVVGVEVGATVDVDFCHLVFRFIIFYVKNQHYSKTGIVLICLNMTKYLIIFLKKITIIIK